MSIVNAKTIEIKMTDRGIENTRRLFEETKQRSEELLADLDTAHEDIENMDGRKFLEKHYTLILKAFEALGQEENKRIASMEDGIASLG